MYIAVLVVNTFIIMFVCCMHFQFRENALHRACEGGNMEICKLLINQGLEVNATDNVS